MCTEAASGLGHLLATEHLFDCQSNPSSQPLLTASRGDEMDLLSKRPQIQVSGLRDAGRAGGGVATVTNHSLPRNYTEVS